MNALIRLKTHKTASPAFSTETEGAYTGAITYGGRDVPYTYTVRDQAQEG